LFWTRVIQNPPWEAIDGHNGGEEGATVAAISARSLKISGEGEERRGKTSKGLVDKDKAPGRNRRQNKTTWPTGKKGGGKFNKVSG